MHAPGTGRIGNLQPGAQSGELRDVDPPRLLGRSEHCRHDPVDVITELEVRNPASSLRYGLDRATSLDNLEVVVAERHALVSEEGGIVTMLRGCENRLVPAFSGVVSIAVQIELVHALLVEAQSAFCALHFIC